MRINEKEAPQFSKSFNGDCALLKPLLLLFGLALFWAPGLHADEAKLIELINKVKGNRSPSLSILYPEGSLPNVEAVAKRFTAKTGIRINTSPASVDDINTKLTIDALRGKTSFDIALPATFGIPDLVKTGVLYNVTDLAKRYEAAIDYQPSLYETGNTYQGRQYGYQTDGDTYLMFYHRAWLNDPNEQAQYLEQFGEPLTVPTSWQELDRQMAFFHRPERGMYGGMLFRTPRYMVWEWWLRLHEKGSAPFDENMHPLINNSQGVSALQEMIDATEYLHPTVKSNGLVENWAQYSKATSYANIGWGGTQKYLYKPGTNNDSTFMSAPTPGISYFNWGWSYVVSNFSTEKELAYLFTLYATLPGPSNLAIRANGFFDPFRAEHYLDQEIVARYSNEFMQNHKAAMENSLPDLYIDGQDQYIGVLQETLTSALEGYVTAQEALDYTAREWERLTDRIGRKEQSRQWRYLRSQYPELPEQ